MREVTDVPWWTSTAVSNEQWAGIFLRLRGYGHTRVEAALHHDIPGRRAVDVAAAGKRQLTRSLTAAGLIRSVVHGPRPADLQGAEDQQQMLELLRRQFDRALFEEYRRALPDGSWIWTYWSLVRYSACLFDWKSAHREGHVLWEGVSPEDLVQEALRGVVSGERRWNPEKASFLRFLRGVVRSVASHHRFPRSPLYSLSALAGPSDPEGGMAAKPGIADRPFGATVERVRSAEDCLLREEAIANLHELVAADPDPDLVVVLELLLQGFKPKEIAAHLSADPTRVYSLVQKLGRRIDKLRRDMDWTTSKEA